MFKPCEYLVKLMVRRTLSANADNDDVWVRVEDAFDLSEMVDDGEDSIGSAAKTKQIVDVVEVDQSGAVVTKGKDEVGVVCVESDVAVRTGEKRQRFCGVGRDRRGSREVFRLVVGKFRSVGVDSVYEVGEFFCPETCEVGRDSESEVVGVDSFEIGQGEMG